VGADAGGRCGPHRRDALGQEQIRENTKRVTLE
jgi:hypothetical protein